MSRILSVSTIFAIFEIIDTLILEKYGHVSTVNISIFVGMAGWLGWLAGLAGLAGKAGLAGLAEVTN